MSRATILALSLVAALALSSGAMAQGGGAGGAGSGAQPEPQATQAAREAVRAATAFLNPPAAKAVRLAIPLLNLPAVRAKIALIPQGRELGLVLRPGAYASDVFPVAVTARLAVDQDFKSRVLVRPSPLLPLVSGMPANADGPGAVIGRAGA
jgi:hypothetical protein